MTHDREVGRVVSWDGERGVIERLAGGSRDTRRLAFTAADVVEGTPEAGHRCTYTPGRGGHAGAVRAKGGPC